MTKVLEADENGALTIPPELLSNSAPHARFSIDARGDQLILARLRPEGSRALPLTNEDLARDFIDWISTLPPGPGLSHEATTRDSIYE